MGGGRGEETGRNGGAGGWPTPRLQPRLEGRGRGDSGPHLVRTLSRRAAPQVRASPQPGAVPTWGRGRPGGAPSFGHRVCGSPCPPWPHIRGVLVTSLLGPELLPHHPLGSPPLTRLPARTPQTVPYLFGAPTLGPRSCCRWGSGGAGCPWRSGQYSAGAWRPGCSWRTVSGPSPRGTSSGSPPPGQRLGPGTGDPSPDVGSQVQEGRGALQSKSERSGPGERWPDTGGRCGGLRGTWG